MASKLNIVDYVVVGIMLLIPASIGIFFRFTGGRQKTALEFLMADKNMSMLPVCFSILATMMSAIALLGTPAEAYLYGTQMMVREFTYPLGVIFATYYILPVYYEMNANSLFVYLERRFGKVIKLVASVLFSIQMILYMPIVIYAPSLALSAITDLSVWTSVVTIATICTFYSTLGGLKAVLWTDLFQGILMVLTVYILIFKGSLDFGGFDKIIETAEKGERLELFNTNTDFTVRYTLWNTIGQGIMYSMHGVAANFMMAQRLISCGNIKKAQHSLLWSIPLCFVFQIGVMFLGITMYSYYNECDPIGNKEVDSVDQLEILFIVRLFGHLPGVSGLCVAGIFSAALSTMSSVINSLAAVTLEDYIKPFERCNRLKGSTMTLIVKMLAVCYGGLCLLLTFVIANAKGVQEAAVLLLGIVGGPTAGVFCLGMFTLVANESGALIGLFTTFLLNAWCAFGTLYNKSTYPPFPLSTEGCVQNINASFSGMYNTNMSLEAEIANFTSDFTQIKTEERDIFVLYKISYIWQPTISFLLTMIIGYIASHITGLWKKTEKDPKLLSPLVRKWFSKSSSLRNENEYIKLQKEIKKNPLDTEYQKDGNETLL